MSANVTTKGGDSVTLIKLSTVGCKRTISRCAVQASATTEPASSPQRSQHGVSEHEAQAKDVGKKVREHLSLILKILYKYYLIILGTKLF